MLHITTFSQNKQKEETKKKREKLYNLYVCPNEFNPSTVWGFLSYDVYILLQGN